MTTLNNEREPVGAAEPQVGRAVYERIVTLMDKNPAPGSSDWAELDYLSHLTDSVEEVGGYDGPLTAPPDPVALDQPHCQKCGAVIEGWICQGCGQEFEENDGGELVFMDGADQVAELKSIMSRAHNAIGSGKYDRASVMMMFAQANDILARLSPREGGEPS